MTDNERIAAIFGAIGLLSYDRKVRELTGLGQSMAKAKRSAEEWLRTCSKCNRSVSRKWGTNRRQRDDGGFDHSSCAPHPTMETL